MGRGALERRKEEALAVRLPFGHAGKASASGRRELLRSVVDPPPARKRRDGGQRRRRQRRAEAGREGRVEPREPVELQRKCVRGQHALRDSGYDLLEDEDRIERGKRGGAWGCGARRCPHPARCYRGS